jgi:hypothetical protein
MVVNASAVCEHPTPGKRQKLWNANAAYAQATALRSLPLAANFDGRAVEAHSFYEFRAVPAIEETFAIGQVSRFMGC